MPESELDDLLDSTVDVDDPATIPLLRCGAVEILGRMPWSSNSTFLVTVDDGTDRTQAIYKPEAGERPLWDFPAGLWTREVATYELADSLGWPVVPPTVTRHDAPAGVGSLQFFVPSQYEEHYFTIREDSAHRYALEQVCLLDLVSNNTDRKGGHCLLGRDGRVWAIDNGLSFHVEFKVRTVLWDFAGEPVPDALLTDLARLVDSGLPDTITSLLDPFERDAVVERARAVIAAGKFPTDPTGRSYPWPMV